MNSRWSFDFKPQTMITLKVDTIAIRHEYVLTVEEKMDSLRLQPKSATRA